MTARDRSTSTTRAPADIIAYLPLARFERSQRTGHDFWNESVEYVMQENGRHDVLNGHTMSRYAWSYAGAMRRAWDVPAPVKDAHLESERARGTAYREEVRSDPERHARKMKRDRARRARHLVKLRADPERFARKVERDRGNRARRLAKLRADPKRYAAFRKCERARLARYMAALRADPARYAAFLARKRANKARMEEVRAT